MGFDPVAFARTGNGAISEQEKPEEFDPVAFALGGRDVLAPKARAAYGADEPSTPMIREYRAPNRADAFMGELVQGATFGYADEIQGMANGNGTRDVMRRQAELNREAHPGYALAGGLTGGALMTAATGGLAGAAGVGAGAVGAGTIGKALASPVARAAVEGAVAGAGYSDADTATGRLTGAALGAAGGAAVAKALPLVGQGIKKVVGGAEGRTEARMIEDLVGSTSPSARNKLLGKGGTKAKDVADVIRGEPEINKALGDAQETYAAVKTVSDRLDDEMSNVYRLVDQADPGLPAAKVRETAAKYTNELRKKFMPEIADRLDGAIEARLATRAAEGAQAAIPASDLRMLVSSVQRQAYEGGTVNPSVAKETSREFSMALRNMLNDHVEDVATRNKLDVAPIRALNKKRSILANLEDVTERNAIRDVGATKIAPFSLDNAERLMKSPGAAVAAVLSGKALPFIAWHGVKAAGRAADAGLAKLAMWVQSRGGLPKIPHSELMERAAQFGISKAAASRLAEIKPAAALRRGAAGI